MYVYMLFFNKMANSPITTIIIYLSWKISFLIKELAHVGGLTITETWKKHRQS